MLFEQRFRDPVATGAVTVTFRRWKARQVKPGGVYRTPIGRIEVESVEVVDVGDVTGSDVAAAGYPSLDALLADLRGTPDLPLYRVRFRPVHDTDPRDELAAADDLDDEAVAELDRRLDRLDRASSWGPWTRATLAAIGEQPGVRAGDLAAGFGRETAPFKVDVRKLKNLGLTISLEVGYRLSPRGRAYLDRTRRAPGAA